MTPPRDPEVELLGIDLLGLERLGDAPARLLTAIGPVTTVRGWATVDLDRATAAVVAGARDATNDQLLGARCRIASVTDSDPDPREIVLLEPSTEGRLAAGLARYGEGPLALYVLAGPAAATSARAAGFALSRRAGGPLGPQRRVIVGPRDGPFLLLVGRG